MGHITWTRGPNSARDDLSGIPFRIASELIAIAERELRAPENQSNDDIDEGRGDPPADALLWRRGITREERQSLIDRERAAGADQDKDSVDASWDYILIYRERTFEEIVAARERGFVVLRVASIRNFATVWSSIRFGVAL